MPKTGTTLFKRLWLTNAMFGVNFFANVIGRLIVDYYFGTDAQLRLLSGNLLEVGADAGLVFRILAMVVWFAAMLYYERPIRKYWRKRFRRESIPEQLETVACRRLINQTFFMVGLNAIIWFLSSLFFTVVFWAYGGSAELVFRSFYVPFAAMLIVAIITFYLADFILQRYLAPIVFPDGGLRNVPGTFRIRIRTRVAAFLYAVNVIPLLAILLLPRRIAYSYQGDPVGAFEYLRQALVIHALFFIAIGLFLTLFLGYNLMRPIREIIHVVHAIRHGDLDHRVRVTSNDEIGYAGEAINEMTEELKEGRKMQHSLDLAMEVQQNLLPRSDPQIDGLDVAGRSEYCDETGGDYYDYIDRKVVGHNGITVVVGDVSGHGISSALLMTTVRALLRHASLNHGSTAAVIKDVNAHLCRDVEDSGQFMTLFFLDVEPTRRLAAWTNAGHESALVYDPAQKTFDELTGRGPALGLNPGFEYHEHYRELKPGEIIFIGTDGVWEARSSKGVMFGREGLKQVIRAHAHLPAEKLVDAIFRERRRFVGSMVDEDDVTLVVIKLDA